MDHDYETASALDTLTLILQTEFPNLAVVKSHYYKDSSPFLDLWKPIIKENVFQGLKYLPSFHILVSLHINDDIGSCLNFRLVTFHGKMVEEANVKIDSAEESMEKLSALLLSSAELNMLRQLYSDRMWFCHGIIKPDMLGSIGTDRLDERFYVEPFEEGTRLRSTKCKWMVKRHFGTLENNPVVCEECDQFNDAVFKSFSSRFSSHNSPVQIGISPKSRRRVQLKIKRLDDFSDQQEMTLKEEEIEEDPDLTMMVDDDGLAEEYLELDPLNDFDDDDPEFKPEHEPEEDAEEFLDDDVENKPVMTLKKVKSATTSNKVKSLTTPKKGKPKEAKKNISDPEEKAAREQIEVEHALDYYFVRESASKEKEYLNDVPPNIVPKNGQYICEDTKERVKFGCKICLKVHALYQLLLACIVDHQQHCDLNEPVRCPLCSEDIARRLDVNDHALKMHYPEENKLVCPLPGLHIVEAGTIQKQSSTTSTSALRRTNTILRLREHILSHRSMDKVTCEECGKTYTQAYFAEHKLKCNNILGRFCRYGREKHLKELCEECGKCVRRDYMQEHKKRCNPKTELTTVIAGKTVKAVNTRAYRRVVVEPDPLKFKDCVTEDGLYEYHLLAEPAIFKDDMSGDSISQKTHRCKICMNSFYNEHRRTLASCMSKHAEKMDFNEPVECPLCSDEIPRRLDLVEHCLTKHARAEKVACPMCLATTDVKKRSLRKHFLAEHTDQTNMSKDNKTKMRCLHCGEIFVKKVELDRHMVSKHTDFRDSSSIIVMESKKPNSRANTVMDQTSGKRIHIRKDFEYDLIEDRLEGQTLLSTEELFHKNKDVREYYTVPDENTKLLFRCKMCKKTHSMCDYVVKCMQVHMKLCNIDEPVKCPICSDVIPRRIDVTDHFTEKHGKTKKVACPICLKLLEDKPDFLRKHIVIKHHPKLHGRFPCNICGSSYKSKKSVGTHMRMVHNPKTIMCESCGKSFPSKCRLKMHLRECNKEVKCPHCNKIHSSVKALHAHMCLHTGLKPFKCVHCSHCVNKRSNLTNHVRKVHSKQFEESDIYVIEDQYLQMRDVVSREMKQLYGKAT